VFCESLWSPFILCPGVICFCTASRFQLVRCRSVFSIPADPWALFAKEHVLALSKGQCQQRCVKYWVFLFAIFLLSHFFSYSILVSLKVRSSTYVYGNPPSFILDWYERVATFKGVSSLLITFIPFFSLFWLKLGTWVFPTLVYRLLVSHSTPNHLFCRVHRPVKTHCKQP